MKIERLFFELLHVAIGNQNSLSKLPSEKEWKALYDMAQKQSLLAVCYMGLKNLGADSDEGFIRIGISEDTYFHWVGMTAIIQQKNQIVDEQCFKLHTKLAMEGMRSCVLKGQGVGQLYDAHLRGLRQSGDIDIWVDAARKDIIKYVQKVAPTTNVREHHIELDAFQETEVEIHFWPAVIRHFLKNRKLQRWFEGKREEQFNNYLKISDSSKTSELKLCVPILEFHAVQQMAHMYHHLFDSGIGLRQVIDYYYVLKALSVR